MKAKNFAINLKKIMTERKLTYLDVSVASEVSTQAVNYIVIGRNMPTLDSAIKISRGLNVCLLYMVGSNAAKNKKVKVTKLPRGKGKDLLCLPW